MAETTRTEKTTGTVIAAAPPGLSVDELLALAPSSRLDDLAAYVRILREGGYPESFVAQEVETRVFGPRLAARRALAEEVEAQKRKAAGPLPRETAGVFMRARASSAEDLSALADQALGEAKKMRLPRGLLEKAREDLSRAFTVEAPLSQALVKRVLDGIEVEVRQKLLRRRKARAAYLTPKRKRILALVGKEPGRTCDIARRAGISWEQAHRRLRGLARRGFIARPTEGGGAAAKVWHVTHAGVKVFDEVPEVEHKMIAGFDAILGILDERQQVRDELRALGMRYDQLRDVLPFYTVDHLRRELAEVRQEHGPWHIEDPGKLLWDRLGQEGTAKRRARIEAARLFTDPKSRAEYVEAAVEKAKLDRFERRRQGLARKIVPQGAGEAYLAATKDEPFYLSLWLAFSLRSRGRKGHQVTAGDVNVILAWIHKKDATRRRPPVQTTGESRYRPPRE